MNIAAAHSAYRLRLVLEHAVEYGPVFAAHGEVAQSKAKMFGGTKAKPNIGVWLDIDAAEELLARLTNDQPFS